MTLAGNVCIRNGFTLDYCFKEAIESLLPICDEVVCCDCDSTDGTREFLDQWKLREPKINICNFAWTDPKGDNMFWPTWLNYARQHAKSDWHIQLDADEILHEDSYEEVLHAVREKKSLICKRYNFWRDAQHLIPLGKCCGYAVIRVGPQNLWMPSDYPDPRANELMSIAEPSTVNIMHYGFLRQREAFFRKAREVQRIWVNSFDPRLAAAEAAGGNWMQHDGVTGWENDLLEFKGTHPAVIRPWLAERGYSV